MLIWEVGKLVYFGQFSFSAVTNVQQNMRVRPIRCFHGAYFSICDIFPTETSQSDCWFWVNSVTRKLVLQLHISRNVSVNERINIFQMNKMYTRWNIIMRKDNSIELKCKVVISTRSYCKHTLGLVLMRNKSWLDSDISRFRVDIFFSFSRPKCETD